MEICTRRKKDYNRIENPDGWYKRLEADSRVDAYSAQVVVAALFSKGGTSVSATLTGCLAKHQANVNTIAANMTDGEFSEIGAGGNRIIVGQKLLRRLGAKLLQDIVVSTGAGSPTPFQIIGVYDSENKAGNLQAYASLADVQRANRTLNRVNEFGVRLVDYEQSASLART